MQVRVENPTVYYLYLFDPVFMFDLLYVYLCSETTSQ